MVGAISLKAFTPAWSPAGCKGEQGTNSQQVETVVARAVPYRLGRVVERPYPGYILAFAALCCRCVKLVGLFSESACTCKVIVRVRARAAY